MKSLIRSLHAGDEGMTLIEVLIAVFILSVAIIAMASAAVTSLHSLRVSRDRQDATQLASSTLERVRALPFDQVAHPSTPAVTGPFEGRTVVSGPAGQVANATTTSEGFTVTTWVTWQTTNLEKNIATIVSWTDGGETRSVRENTLLARARRGLPAPDFSISPDTQADSVVDPSAVKCFSHQLTNTGEQDRYDWRLDLARWTKPDGTTSDSTPSGYQSKTVDHDIDPTTPDQGVHGFKAHGWFVWTRLEDLTVSPSVMRAFAENTSDQRPDSQSFVPRKGEADLHLCYTRWSSTETPQDDVSFRHEFRSQFDTNVSRITTDRIAVSPAATNLYLHHPRRNNGTAIPDDQAGRIYSMNTILPTSTAVSENYDKSTVDGRPGLRLVAGGATDNATAWDYQFPSKSVIGTTGTFRFYGSSGLALDALAAGTAYASNETLYYKIKLEKLDTSKNLASTLIDLPVSADSYQLTQSGWTQFQRSLDAELATLTSAQRTFGVGEFLRLTFTCIDNDLSTASTPNCHLHYDVDENGSGDNTSNQRLLARLEIPVVPQ